ncbi:sensitivity to red-light reduced protein [Tilletia horrida]|nr:sensitivity to red-light reduced protein [Tilletia horrida]
MHASAAAANTPPLLRGTSTLSVSTSSATTDGRTTPLTTTDSSQSVSSFSELSSAFSQHSSPLEKDLSALKITNTLASSSGAIPKEAVSPTTQSSGSMRVLLVDDNPLNLALLLRLLHRKFSDELDPQQPPIALTDSTTALDLLKGDMSVADAMRVATPATVRKTMPEPARQATDAACLTEPNPSFTHIILDIHMPAISGLSLARRIRGLPFSSPNRDAHLLACTTAVRAEEQILYRAGGFDGLIEKPVRENTMRAYLDHLAAFDEQDAFITTDSRRSSMKGLFSDAQNALAASPQHPVFDGGGQESKNDSASHSASGDQDHVSQADQTITENSSLNLAPAFSSSESSLDSHSSCSGRSQRLARSRSLGAQPLQAPVFFLALHNVEPQIITGPILSMDASLACRRANSPNQLSSAKVEEHVVQESLRSPHYITQGFFLPDANGDVTIIQGEDTFDTDPQTASPARCKPIRHLRQISAAPIDPRDLADVRRDVDLESFSVEESYFDAATNQIIRRVSGADENLTESEMAGEVGTPDVETAGAYCASPSTGYADIRVGTSLKKLFNPVRSASVPYLHQHQKLPSPRFGSSNMSSGQGHFSTSHSSDRGAVVVDLERELADELEHAAVDLAKKKIKHENEDKTGYFVGVSPPSSPDLLRSESAGRLLCLDSTDASSEISISIPISPAPSMVDVLCELTPDPSDLFRRLSLSLSSSSCCHTASTSISEGCLPAEALDSPDEVEADKLSLTQSTLKAASLRYRARSLFLPPLRFPLRSNKGSEAGAISPKSSSSAKDIPTGASGLSMRSFASLILNTRQFSKYLAASSAEELVNPVELVSAVKVRPHSVAIPLPSLAAETDVRASILGTGLETRTRFPSSSSIKAEVHQEQLPRILA